MTGNDDENVSDTFEALAEFDECFEIVRETGARQITRIYSLLAHPCELGAVAPPEPYRPPASGKLQRERGAPGARAEDGYWL
jgi:hypothetical protein